MLPIVSAIVFACFAVQDDKLLLSFAWDAKLSRVCWRQQQQMERWKYGAECLVLKCTMIQVGSIRVSWYTTVRMDLLFRSKSDLVHNCTHGSTVQVNTE
jgi:hypothetical protein